MAWCPGFGQDGVNFHQNPGRGTAGRADANLAKQSRVFHTMCRHAGFRWGELGVAIHSQMGGSAAVRSERAAVFCGLCSAGLCSVFPLSVLLFLFPLFAVLLNCPYPNPPVSACFFPFSSAPRQGRGGRVALLLPAAAKPEH